MFSRNLDLTVYKITCKCKQLQHVHIAHPNVGPSKAHPLPVGVAGRTYCPLLMAFCLPPLHPLLFYQKCALNLEIYFSFSYGTSNTIILCTRPKTESPFRLRQGFVAWRRTVSPCSIPMPYVPFRECPYRFKFRFEQLEGLVITDNNIGN